MVDQAVIDAFGATPERITIVGPRRFLRAAGADNNPYGRWWFEEGELFGIQAELDRIPLPAGHRQEAILGRIRSATAISVDWNTLSEFWLLDLPTAQSTEAYVGPARAQTVFSATHKLHTGALVLRGGIKQYYFPVLNPLWVYRYGSIRDL